MAVALRFLQGCDATLESAARHAARTIASKLTGLIDRPIECDISQAMLVNSETIAGFFSGGVTVAHGTMSEGAENRARIILPERTSISLAAYMRMSPDDAVLASRNEGRWSPEHDEAFDEVAGVMFKALDDALLDKTVSETSVRYIGYERIESAGGIDDATLGSDPLVGYSFSCKVADFAPESGYLLFPLEVAEELNGAPLRYGEDADACDDDIEAAPIRGKLAAYVSSQDLFQSLRRSCRRVGLTLDRRPKTEVPNPAAFRDQVVLIEIPHGQEKRFDWCRRLKASGQGVQAVLLLREPTRVAVAMAFRAQADAVLGCPTSEGQLSRKLEGLLAVAVAD